MKEIKLSKGKVTLVDDDAFECLNKWKWYAWKHGNTFYAVRSASDDNSRTVYMHREILGLSNPKQKVDHKDRNGLNNQKHNLRIATHLQNMANRGSHKNSSSKYLGVSWRANRKTWKTTIMTNGVSHYIGCFKNEIDAALAYNNAAIKLHGDFANINEIDVKRTS